MKPSLIPILLIALAGIVAYPAFASSTATALPDLPTCDAGEAGPFEDPYCCECASIPDPEVEVFMCQDTHFVGFMTCEQMPSFICWEGGGFCEPWEHH